MIAVSKIINVCIFLWQMRFRSTVDGRSGHRPYKPRVLEEMSLKKEPETKGKDEARHFESQ